MSSVGISSPSQFCTSSWPRTRPDNMILPAKLLPPRWITERKSGNRKRPSIAAPGNTNVSTDASLMGVNAIKTPSKQKKAPKRLSERIIAIVAAPNIPQKMRRVCIDRIKAQMKTMMPKFPAETGSRKIEETRWSPRNGKILRPPNSSGRIPLIKRLDDCWL